MSNTTAHAASIIGSLLFFLTTGAGPAAVAGVVSYKSTVFSSSSRAGARPPIMLTVALNSVFSKTGETEPSSPTNSTGFIGAPSSLSG